MAKYHTPVLLKETVDFLDPGPGKLYIDVTLGGGGHAEEILRRGGELLGIDRDPEAIDYVRSRLGNYEEKNQAQFVQGNFENILEIASDRGFSLVRGIVYDLGVSSHQLESFPRGFSFKSDAPLDMRMNPDLRVSAQDLVLGLGVKELEKLFKKYGQEKFAKQIAKAIVDYREGKKEITCQELAEVIKKAVPFKGHQKIHPATRCFQALRIAVNDELRGLERSLPQAAKLLVPAGKLAVITFHSLEDQVVKQFVKESSDMSLAQKGAVLASSSEIGKNPRARSAKLWPIFKKD